jgi:hypothetical protein
MKRRTPLYFALFMLTPFACKKNKGPIVCCAMINTGVHISVSTTSNLDLLNPTTPGAFREDNIEVFEKKAAGYTRVFNGNMDNPKGFGIDLNPKTNTYQMNLGVSTAAFSPDTSVTLIKFGDHVPDTIRAIVVKDAGYIHVTRVRMNSISFDKDSTYRLIK